MSNHPDQIYSATYSNVPVFEFVTSEGPIMRRKSDAWINATHILKIAKFPKARRTRILEKDVQTGIHEKVQGGYGKYQGTYVPLQLGAEIAKSFGVYEVLKPIFDFEYVEGKSETPPPAPKHNHASASNFGRRQLQSQKPKKDPGLPNQKSLLMVGNPISDTVKDTSKKAKRVTLTGRANNATLGLRQFQHPNMGTFNTRPESSFSNMGLQLPPLSRQDTERDALLIMASGMNIHREDLEMVSSDDELHPQKRARKLNSEPVTRDLEEDELMTGKELFGSRDFGASQGSFEKVVQMHNLEAKKPAKGNASRILSLNGSLGEDSHDLLQYHHQSQVATNNLRGDAESIEYFETLLNYFLEDNPQSMGIYKEKQGVLNLPEKILNPPQPLSKIDIGQPIDSDGNTIFHWACSMANVGMIQFLLSIFSNFISSEIKNYNGETPLMFMVKFNNSYQMKNFNVILDLLFDSVLSVDNRSRTILHHIALACTSTKGELFVKHSSDEEWRRKKERFAKYYIDAVFSKIIEFPEFQLLQGDQSRDLEDKRQVIAKFIDHQDNEGNTAFHIVAHNLSKKCIKTFIKYHKYIDFSLRNYVNYTVEDYLAAHNYVLRLEPDRGFASSSENGNTENGLFSFHEFTQSFETHKHRSKTMMAAQNDKTNTITEKLSELSYTMQKELSEKDEILGVLYQFSRILKLEMAKSQKSVLQYFSLDHLVELENESNGQTSQDESKNPNNLIIEDRARGGLIQEEISQLNNDMSFQVLALQDELGSARDRYAMVREKNLALQLILLEQKFRTTVGSNSKTADRLEQAVQLQKQILKRGEILEELYKEAPGIPLFAEFPDEMKENVNIKNEPHSETIISETTTESTLEKIGSTISNFPPEDKLHKYCKLIASSCGMTFAEVENSIDLIEHSLLRTVNHNI